MAPWILNAGPLLEVGSYVYIQSGPKKMYTLFTHQYLWNKFK